MNRLLQLVDDYLLLHFICSYSNIVWMYTEDLNSPVDCICNAYYQQEVNIGEICLCHAPSSDDYVHTNYVYTVVL